MPTVLNTRLGRTLLPWRMPLRVTKFVVDEASQLPRMPVVEVDLEPGESRSVRVGEREYVTVRRTR